MNPVLWKRRPVTETPDPTVVLSEPPRDAVADFTDALKDWQNPKGWLSKPNAPGDWLVEYRDSNGTLRRTLAEVVKVGGRLLCALHRTGESQSLGYMPRGRWRLVDWESTEVAPTTLKSSPNFVNGTASEIDRPLTSTKQYAA